MTKLTDLQLVLLSAAAARTDGHLLPPPDSVADQLPRIRKAIPTLMKRNLVVEAAATKAAQVWRDQDGKRFGVVLTDAGRAAIGVVETDPAHEQKEPENAATGLIAPPPTKAALVLTLLRRDDGATLSELVAATGWLPHTTRAALTGLRKKGHVLDKSKRADVTCYRISVGA